MDESDGPSVVLRANRSYSGVDVAVEYVLARLALVVDGDVVGRVLAAGAGRVGAGDLSLSFLEKRPMACPGVTLREARIE